MYFKKIIGVHVSQAHIDQTRAKNEFENVQYRWVALGREFKFNFNIWTTWIFVSSEIGYYGQVRFSWMVQFFQVVKSSYMRNINGAQFTEVGYSAESFVSKCQLEYHVIRYCTLKCCFAGCETTQTVCGRTSQRNYRCAADFVYYHCISDNEAETMEKFERFWQDADGSGLITLVLILPPIQIFVAITNVSAMT